MKLLLPSEPAILTVYPQEAQRTMEIDRVSEALAYLKREFSVDADEFRRDNAPGGEMLMMGVLSKGYANEKGGRYAVSEAGRRLLAEAGE